MIRIFLATATALACLSAQAQTAAAPAFGPDAPWAQAYAKCANAALERGVAAARDPKPWPVQIVPPAEHECVGEVPATDSLGVRATVALVRNQLLGRFGQDRSLALAPRSPLRLPEMFPMGEGVACPHPDYPPAALRAAAEGTSAVVVTFDAQGLLVDGRIVSPSGPTREHRILDRTALESFALCQVPPAGKPGNRSFGMSYGWHIAEDTPPAGAKP